MIRFLLRILKWLAITLVVLVLILLTPVAYNELACTADPEDQTYVALVTDPKWHRTESRSHMTYPEWHIVHAYDDYAKVIEAGDPHEFGYIRAIRGFWGSLCALTEVSAQHGGFDTVTKQTIYTIGVSFSLELAAKAAYEETLGRLVALLRGGTRSALDDLSAKQARAYANFLQQVPWYRWDFSGDITALKDANQGGLRDTERRLALGIEFGVKAGYAKVIANAVAAVGGDQLRLRMVVANADPKDLEALPGVAFVEALPEGLVFETPRYRELTHLLVDMAKLGADFIEIAGNDDIMLTAIAPLDTVEDALFSFERQGYGDKRLLVSMPVRDLADYLRRVSEEGSAIQTEHVHDY